MKKKKKLKLFREPKILLLTEALQLSSLHYHLT